VHGFGLVAVAGAFVAHLVTTPAPPVSVWKMRVLLRLNHDSHLS